MKSPFERLLVANRGEIARRVIRTARRLGIHTIAVCSDIDETAPFAREADEAHVLGPAAPKESYLAVERILAVAEETGAEAIHPGYGFLSENAEFAERVGEAGKVFVGPRPETIRAVGGKLAARALAEQANVPVVPGSPRVETLEEARAAAEKIGFPLVIKAAAGGGGIGMSIVTKEKKLERAFEDAKKKGQTFFGDDTVYIERLIEKPAHVEVQILGDVTGKAYALGERDCTVQRRHQKVVEETPSPRVDADTRAGMLDAAVRLAEAADYRNAGTVEMIYAGGGDLAGRFFFLEVNSRLQVEHPVTEMVTGLDLVELQLRIAAGESVARTLEAVEFRGHAIEARICAEDPEKRFFPQPGTLETVRFADGEGIRIDSGVESGSVVPPTYDSLLAKVVAHGETREAAVARLKEALAASELSGIKTNLEVFGRIFEHPVFREGRHDTGFLLEELGLKS